MTAATAKCRFQHLQVLRQWRMETELSLPASPKPSKQSDHGMSIWAAFQHWQPLLRWALRSVCWSGEHQREMGRETLCHLMEHIFWTLFCLNMQKKCRFKLPGFPGERNGESLGYFCPAGDVGALWSAHVWFSSQDLCLPQCRGWPDRSAEIAQLRTESVFCFSFYWLCGTISTISFSTA